MVNVSRERLADHASSFEAEMKSEQEAIDACEDIFTRVCVCGYHSLEAANVLDQPQDKVQAYAARTGFDPEKAKKRRKLLGI